MTISIHENLRRVRIHLKNHCQTELSLVVTMVVILFVVKMRLKVIQTSFLK